MQTTLKDEWLDRMEKFFGTVEEKVSWWGKPVPAWAVLLAAAFILLCQHGIKRFEWFGADYHLVGLGTQQGSNGKPFYIPIYERTR